ncbi:MAG: glycoside hydrolase [Prolixibacteraceae bacterium]|nr:glycoside hydrolase [Prolixibacteraceae bacterium]MBN2774639.1 glycoside hydrolase [Prolixibacteraceae bacterium]
MKPVIKYYILCLFLIVGNITFAQVFSGDINLNGKWKFAIGDGIERAKENYNDSGWTEISAPGNWEDQGFRRYDGFAWYRKKFIPDVRDADRIVVLELGYIDDSDEVYLNGVLVGRSGSFPPNYLPGSKSHRKYMVPNQIVHFGKENTIAIRVYDAQLDGGIVEGDLKVHFSDIDLPFDINLAGEWFLNQGKRVDQQEKQPVIVPGLWENQGFYDMDGYAVYSKSVYFPEKLKEKKLIFMAGRIDDVDQVYINGIMVGSTGKYDERESEDNYLEFRNYFIPDGIIKFGQDNIIEVRVWDERWDGGIIEGPVGIISQDKFREYWMAKRRN